MNAQYTLTSKHNDINTPADRYTHERTVYLCLEVQGDPVDVAIAYLVEAPPWAGLRGIGLNRHGETVLVGGIIVHIFVIPDGCHNGDGGGNA